MKRLLLSLLLLSLSSCKLPAPEPKPDAVAPAETGVAATDADSAEKAPSPPTPVVKKEAEPVQPPPTVVVDKLVQATVDIQAPESAGVVKLIMQQPEGWYVEQVGRGLSIRPTQASGIERAVTIGVSAVCGGSCKSQDLQESLLSLLKGRLAQVRKFPYPPVTVPNQALVQGKVDLVEEDWEFGKVGMWVAKVVPEEPHPAGVEAYYRFACLSRRPQDPFGIQVLIRVPADISPETYQALLKVCRSSEVQAVGLEPAGL